MNHHKSLMRIRLRFELKQFFFFVVCKNSPSIIVFHSTSPLNSSTYFTQNREEHNYLFTWLLAFHNQIYPHQPKKKWPKATTLYILSLTFANGTGLFYFAFSLKNPFANDESWGFLVLSYYTELLFR